MTWPAPRECVPPGTDWRTTAADPAILTKPEQRAVHAALAAVVNTLHARRVELGWGLRATARATVGAESTLSAPAVRDLERGSTWPRADVVARVAEVLGFRLVLHVDPPNGRYVTEELPGDLDLRDRVRFREAYIGVELGWLARERGVDEDRWAWRAGLSVSSVRRALARKSGTGFVVYGALAYAVGARLVVESQELRRRVPQVVLGTAG